MMIRKGMCLVIVFLLLHLHGFQPEHEEEAKGGSNNSNGEAAKEDKQEQPGAVVAR